MRKKKSLFLWADNVPYVQHANAVLRKYFDGMYLEGNYHGTKIITKSDDVKKGTFKSNHSITYGLNNLYEGITICHPVNTHPDFTVLAKNSNDEDLILYAEESDTHGRLMIDTGITKLYNNWKDCGTHQYVSNSNVWLTGIPI